MTPLCSVCRRPVAAFGRVAKVHPAAVTHAVFCRGSGRPLLVDDAPLRPATTDGGAAPAGAEASAKAVGFDRINCRACKAVLTQLNTPLLHIHGMSPEEYRAIYGADAPIMDGRHLAAFAETAKATGAKKHEANARTCDHCHRPFTRGKLNGKRDGRADRSAHCSDECVRATRSARAREPKQIERLRVAATNSKNRIAYLERMKAEKIARQTHACTVCGTPFVSVRRKLTAGVCSFACRSEHARKKRSAGPLA